MYSFTNTRQNCKVDAGIKAQLGVSKKKYIFCRGAVPPLQGLIEKGKKDLLTQLKVPLPAASSPLSSGLDS